MNNMQAWVDGMSAQWQRDRSATQMTLGKLIERLESMPPQTMIDGIYDPHSYRGYYCDLAFEIRGKKPVADVLAICRSAMGEVFQGYKGGDYQMGKATPVWIASYGRCGQKIVALRDDGTFELAEDEQ